MLAFQRSRREAIEAAIHDLEPELRRVSVIAVRILAAKGIDLPTPTIRKMTKSGLRAALLAFGKRGWCGRSGWVMSGKRNWAVKERHATLGDAPFQSGSFR